MVTSLMRQTLDPMGRYPFRVWDDYQFIRKGIRGSGGGRPMPPETPSRPLNTAPPIVSGTTVSGQTLHCTSGSWSSTVALVFSYQWVRGLAPFDAPVGTNSPNYLLTGDDVTFVLSCVVTASNVVGSSSAASNIVGPVEAALAPTNTGLPVLTGSTSVGATLTTTNGTWDGVPTPTFTRQWKRGSTNIGSGALTYVTVTADIGFNITCVVTATNAGGSAAATSNALGPITGVVAPTAPVNTILPDVTGAETEGLPLDCTTGTWSGTTPITYEYQWYQVEVVGPPTPPVAGTPAPSVSGSTTRGSTLHVTTGTWTGNPTPAYSYQWKRLPSTSIGTSSSSYMTVPADVGFDITCTVTATNASGTASQAASNSRGPIVEPLPGDSLVDEEGEVLLDETGEELTTDA